MRWYSITQGFQKCNSCSILCRGGALPRPFSRKCRSLGGRGGTEPAPYIHDRTGSLIVTTAPPPPAFPMVKVPPWRPMISSHTARPMPLPRAREVPL